MILGVWISVADWNAATGFTDRNAIVREVTARAASGVAHALPLAARDAAVLEAAFSGNYTACDEEGLANMSPWERWECVRLKFDAGTSNEEVDTRAIENEIRQRMWQGAHVAVAVMPDEAPLDL